MSYISDNSYSYDLTDLINSLVCGNAIQMELCSIFSIAGRYAMMSERTLISWNLVLLLVLCLHVLSIYCIAASQSSFVNGGCYISICLSPYEDNLIMVSLDECRHQSIL